MGEEDLHAIQEAETAAALAHATDAEEAFVRAFEREPTDGSWATQWEASLERFALEDFGALDGFSNFDVECRSSRCVATVTWRDYEAATARVGDASFVSRGACATTTFMPPPDDTSRSYTHRIRFQGCRTHENL